MHVKTLLATLATLALTAAPALAATGTGSGCSTVKAALHECSVPEVGSTGSLAAIVAVLAVGLIVWERRRRRAS